jgi:hypothetical protein
MAIIQTKNYSRQKLRANRCQKKRAQIPQLTKIVDLSLCCPHPATQALAETPRMQAALKIKCFRRQKGNKALRERQKRQKLQEKNYIKKSR